MIARRQTEHGSGLGRYRWVVERTFAWLHQLQAAARPLRTPRRHARRAARARLLPGLLPPTQEAHSEMTSKSAELRNLTAQTGTLLLHRASHRRPADCPRSAQLGSRSRVPSTGHRRRRRDIPAQPVGWQSQRPARAALESDQPDFCNVLTAGRSRGYLDPRAQERDVPPRPRTDRGVSWRIPECVAHSCQGPRLSREPMRLSGRTGRSPRRGIGHARRYSVLCGAAILHAVRVESGPYSVESSLIDE